MTEPLTNRQRAGLAAHGLDRLPEPPRRGEFTALDRLKFDHIKEHFRNGVSDTARRLNMHRATVQRIIKRAERAGLHLNRPRYVPPPPRPHGVDARIPEILEALKQGKNLREIGETLGVSRQRVHQIYLSFLTAKRIEEATQLAGGTKELKI
jgi:transposase-like protein